MKCYLLVEENIPILEYDELMKIGKSNTFFVRLVAMEHS